MIHFLVLAAVMTPPTEATNPASAVSATDPSALKDAIAFLDAMNFEQEALQSSEISIEAMIALITERIRDQTQQEIPEDFMASLNQAMRDHVSDTMRAKMPSMKRQAAEIYAREFTREELSRIRDLSADPVMVKLREKGKSMNPQLMLIGINAMRESEPEFEAKIGRLVEEYLNKIGKGDDKS